MSVRCRPGPARPHGAQNKPPTARWPLSASPDALPALARGPRPALPAADRPSVPHPRGGSVVPRARVWITSGAPYALAEVQHVLDGCGRHGTMQLTRGRRAPHRSKLPELNLAAKRARGGETVRAGVIAAAMGLGVGMLMQ